MKWLLLTLFVAAVYARKLVFIVKHFIYIYNLKQYINNNFIDFLVVICIGEILSILLVQGLSIYREPVLYKGI